MAISLSVTLQESDLKDAVADWLDKNGFVTTDRFAITISTVRGDRPHDADHTTVTAHSGVHVREHSGVQKG